MSAERLASAAAMYADIIAKDDLRGVVLLVARRGKIVLHEAYGFRGLAREKGFVSLKWPSRFNTDLRRFVMESREASAAQ